MDKESKRKELNMSGEGENRVKLYKHFKNINNQFNISMMKAK